MEDCFGTNETKTKKVQLETFHSQNAGSKKNTKKTSVKKDECTALLRVTQMLAAGQNVDVVDLIGNHECSKFPPAV